MSLMDTEVIAKACKKRLIINLLLKVLLLLAYVATLTCLIIWSIFPVIFFCGITMLLAVNLLGKLVDIKIPISYTFTCIKGRVVKVHIDKKSVRETKIGGVGFGKRRGDHDRRDITVCDIFIESGQDKISVVHFEDFSEKHCEYYKIGDEVVRLFGARLPVKTGEGVQERVCPVCGEFNSSNGKCRRCKLTLLK